MITTSSYSLLLYHAVAITQRTKRHDYCGKHCTCVPRICWVRPGSELRALLSRWRTPILPSSMVDWISSEALFVICSMHLTKWYNVAYNNICVYNKTAVNKKYLFTTAAPLAWNELPADIRDITTTVTFKKHLKTLLFNVAYGPALLWHSYIVFYLAFYN